jgi:hypothetical protein
MVLILFFKALFRVFIALLLIVVMVSLFSPSKESTSAVPAIPVVSAQQEKKVDGCDVNTSSKLATEHKVSNILNLQKDIDPNGRCTVKFDLIVDGITHHLEETETGYEQIPSLCYYATERARKNLLLDIGGTFKSESNITCRIHDTN